MFQFLSKSFSGSTEQMGREQLQNMVDDMPVAAVLCDPETLNITYLNEASKKLKEARLNFPKNLATADDIDARDYFIRNVLVMTKLAGQKEFEMDLDKSYKRKKVTHSCYLK